MCAPILGSRGWRIVALGAAVLLIGLLPVGAAAPVGAVTSDRSGEMVDPALPVGNGPATVQSADPGTRHESVDRQYPERGSSAGSPNPTPHAGLPLAAFIELGGIGFDMEYDPAREVIYVSIPSLNRIEVVSLTTLSVTDTITVVPSPHGIDISLDGSRLYAALNTAGSIAYVDLDTQTVTDVVDLSTELEDARTWDTVEGKPNRVFVSANPGSSGLAKIVMVEVDNANAASVVASNRIIRAGPIFARSPDHNSLYVGEGFIPNSLYKLDLTQAAAPIIVEDDHGAVNGTQHLDVSPDATRIYLRSGQILRTASLTQAGSIGPGPSQLNPSGASAYVGVIADGSPVKVAVYDVATQLETAELPLQCPAGNPFGSGDPIATLRVLPDDSGVLVLAEDLVCVARTTNQPPIAVDDGPFVVRQGGTLDATGLLSNDTDPDSDPLEVAFFTDPTHGTLSVFTDGSFIYTHDGSASTSDSFTYEATDGALLSNTATVTLQISPEPPPVAVDDGPFVVAQGGTLDATGLLSNDTDPEGDPLEVAFFTDPTHGFLSVFTDGSFIYTHDGSASTSDSFTYEATDGLVLSNTATVTLQISPEPPPVAVDDGPFVVAQGGTLDATGLLSNDTDPEGDPLEVASFTDPTYGTLSVFRDGSFIYTHDGSASTSDSFTYEATDGLALSNTATVTITVALPPPPADTVGLVDPTQGQWHLRNEAGQVTSFFFGNPGDVPFMGDWDCDGVDTPGLFRTSDAFAYLSNANRSQVADIRFFFGNPSDVPLAGDWDGDGCDTLSIYRPDEQRFYIVNKLGQNEGGLGPADYFFTFGNPGDKPVVGDWDGDGIDEVGLHRESTGFFYWRNNLDSGIADGEIFFGDPNDRFVAGDWGIVDGKDTPAVFRPSNTTMFFRHNLTAGVADSQFVFGETAWSPVAGAFGLG